MLYLILLRVSDEPACCNQGMDSWKGTPSVSRCQKKGGTVPVAHLQKDAKYRRNSFFKRTADLTLALPTQR